MSYNSETNMYEGYIYKIYNDINNKLYIGQTTKDIKTRFKNHYYEIKTCTHTDKIHNAMKKYGFENFHIIEIERFESSELNLLKQILNEKEVYYIEYFDSYKNGYNANLGGGNNDHYKKKVYKYDLNGNYISEYESIQDIDDIDDVFCIYECCNGKTKYACGYIWRYEKYNKLENIDLSDSEYKTAITRIKTKNKIYEYSYNGELLNIFKNLNTLLDYYKDIKNINRSAILKCCNGYNKLLNLKTYRFEGDSFDKYDALSDKYQIVEQFDLNNNLINVFSSIREASRLIGINREYIRSKFKNGEAINTKEFILRLYRKEDEVA